MDSQGISDFVARTQSPSVMLVFFFWFKIAFSSRSVKKSTSVTHSPLSTFFLLIPGICSMWEKDHGPLIHLCPHYNTSNCPYIFLPPLKSVQSSITSLTKYLFSAYYLSGTKLYKGTQTRYSHYPQRAMVSRERITCK